MVEGFFVCFYTVVNIEILSGSLSAPMPMPELQWLTRNVSMTIKISWTEPAPFSGYSSHPACDQRLEGLEMRLLVRQELQNGGNYLVAMGVV